MKSSDDDNVVQFKIKQSKKSSYPNDLEPPKPNWNIEFKNIKVYFVSTPPNRFKRWAFGLFFGCKVKLCKESDDE